MNERIDILLTSAKVASRNNPWASLATHAISMAYNIYNISMIGQYGYQLQAAKATNYGYDAQECARSIQRERIKHSVLLGLDIASLYLQALSNSDNQ